MAEGSQRGEIFIDRSGRLFSHVLEHLRCLRYGESPAALPTSPEDLHTLHREVHSSSLPPPPQCLCYEMHCNFRIIHENPDVVNCRLFSHVLEHLRCLRYGENPAALPTSPEDLHTLHLEVHSSSMRLCYEMHCNPRITHENPDVVNSRQRRYREGPVALPTSPDDLHTLHRKVHSSSLPLHYEVP